MIYRGCELRCIAEVRAESDNHDDGWCIEAAAFRAREENEDDTIRRPIKIDVSFTPARSFSLRAKRYATDIE